MARQKSTASRVREIVQHARDSGASGAKFEVLALIAERLAGIVDSARDDPARQLAALKDLRSTFEQMELDGDGDQPPAGGESGDDGGGVDPRAREMAELMGSGPTGGDAAHS